MRDGEKVVNFARYGKTGGGAYHDSWGPFSEALYRRNRLKSTWDVLRLANRYGVDKYSPHSGVGKIPDNIPIRPSRYIPQRSNMKNKHNKDYDILIYSKWCLECDYPDEVRELNLWSMKNNLSYKIIRTVYRPKDHKRAIELWSSRAGVTDGESEDYPPFVVYNDITSFKEFIDMIKDTKNKLVEEGETKSELHTLPKTKRTARTRRVAKTVDTD